LYLNLEDNGVPVTSIPVRGRESSLSLKITQTSQYTPEGPTQACRAANGLAQFFTGSHIGDLPGKFQDRYE